jgi:hypothetical protein
MSNIKLSQSAVTSLTVTGLSTLASAATATSNVIDNTANLFFDYLIEITVATTNTPSGDKQIVIFVTDSLDQSNFSDSSVQQNMVLLGTVQTPTTSTTYRGRAMSVASAFGGTLPPQFKVVVFNDLGVALTSGTAQYVGSYATVI